MHQHSSRKKILRELGLTALIEPGVYGGLMPYLRVNYTGDDLKFKVIFLGNRYW